MLAATSKAKYAADLPSASQFALANKRRTHGAHGLSGFKE
tara:strand:+ start:515 stop:634 length:120 start_codon:yes stop_codon:yes gene_type:complete